MFNYLSYWKDSVGVKFINATNKANVAFNNGVQEVNKELQKASYIASRRVPIQSHSKEINSLIVR